jgi:hypothetical protein
MISFLIKEASSLLQQVVESVAHLNHVKDKVSTLCGCLAGIIPFNVHCRPILEVHGLPEWIVAREEGAAISVELVGEYEIIFVAVKAGAGVRV